MFDKKYYELLGLDENCSDSELEAKYKELRAKYSEERFEEGERGNRAAKMLTELDNAYSEIKSKRESFSATAGTEGFSKIEEDIRCGKFNDAQDKLDSFDNRSAEWHYLQSVVYYKKNWMNESKKQLEICLKMDADNAKYKSDYEKLKKEIEFSNKQFASGGANGEERRYDDPDARQMGGNDCLSSCCQCLACNMLLNCCCNCR